MFWSKNKKNRYTPCIPQFCYIKVGFKGVYITRTCFLDETGVGHSGSCSYSKLQVADLHTVICREEKQYVEFSSRLSDRVDPV